MHDKVHTFTLREVLGKTPGRTEPIPIYCCGPPDPVGCDQNQPPSRPPELAESFFVHDEIEVLNVKVAQQITH